MLEHPPDIISYHVLLYWITYYIKLDSICIYILDIHTDVGTPSSKKPAAPRPPPGRGLGRQGGPAASLRGPGPASPAPGSCQKALSLGLGYKAASILGVLLYIYIGDPIVWGLYLGGSYSYGGPDMKDPMVFGSILGEWGLP